jgi:hypothetical protein
MAEATDSVHLTQLRTRLHHATITIALQRALWATKAQLQRQGLKISAFRYCELRTQAEAYLADHREELLAEAAALVERWRQEGFFGKRAQCAALSNNDQPKAR